MREWKRILSLVICAVMLLGMVPASAFTVRAGGLLGEYVEVDLTGVADDVTPVNRGWQEMVTPIPGEAGADDVKPSGGNWVAVQEPVIGSTTYHYTRVETLASGDYAFVGMDHAVAMMNNNGTVGKLNVTLSNGDDGKTMTSTEPLTLWTVTLTSGTGTQRNGTVKNGNWYLSVNHDNTYTQIVLKNDAYTFHINQDHTSGNSRIAYHFKIYQQITVGSNTRYPNLRYDGNNWNYLNDAAWLRFYELTDTDIVVAQNGVYYKLSGKLTYDVTATTTAEEALALVQAGLTAYTVEAEQTPGAGVSGTEVDDSSLTWEWVDTYQVGVPGDYALRISYNGKELGVAEVIVPPGDDRPGTWYKLVGEMTTLATEGMTAEEALALVKENLAVHSISGMTAPAADATGEAIDDAAVTWTLDPAYDPNVPGDYAVEITHNGKSLGTAEVITPGSVKYYRAEGQAEFIVPMDTTADGALEAVKEGIHVSVSDDTNGTNRTPIDDEAVEWVWLDTYDGKNTGPYTVDIRIQGVSLGTVEVEVNVNYDEGFNESWTPITVVGQGYEYELDTDGTMEAGVGYLIVHVSNAQALSHSGTTLSSTTDLTIQGNIATVDSRDHEWIRGVNNNNTNKIYTNINGTTYYLRSNSTLTTNRNNGTDWTRTHQGNGRYTLSGQGYYVTSDGMSTTNTSVRLYKYKGEAQSGTNYFMLEGNSYYLVDPGTPVEEALNRVKQGVTGYMSAQPDGSNPYILDDDDLEWTWLNDYRADVQDSYWMEISRNGVSLGIVEVRVQEKVINHYPEYPDEGSVRVHKTATGLDFQASGLVQVELSASGIPIKKGVDLIVMLDTSSSMDYCMVCNSTKHENRNCPNGGKTRAQVLEESLTNLINQLQTPGEDGQTLDIRVAICDFNGFYESNTGMPFARDDNDTTGSTYSANSQAKVYTNDNINDKSLGVHSFKAATDLDAAEIVGNMSYHSGTNYDYAMDAIYQLGTAIKGTWESEDERDLFVMFMTDGATMQWNYYSCVGGTSGDPQTRWNYWLTGAWGASDLTSPNLNCTTHSYYYDLVDHDNDGQINEHRMANAIKGDPEQWYEVIRKNTNGLPAENIKAGSKTNLYMVPGLGATMWAISFAATADGGVTKESIDITVESLATDPKGTTSYYYEARTAQDLDTVFASVGREIIYAATNARFVDELGDDFDLQMEPSTYEVVVRDANGDLVDENGDGKADVRKETVTPVIQILSYPLWSRAEAEADPNDSITEAMIGDRKGDAVILETVSFKTVDGKIQAFSNRIGGGNTNIMGEDGVIYAQSFFYNTNGHTPVKINTKYDNVPVAAGGNPEDGWYTLGPETFYWTMDTITTTELAIRYIVHLTGSMDGTRDAGSYETNKKATLFYTNYLNHDEAQQAATPPSVAWLEAAVSYAFYLVNEKGEIVVNQTTGQTGSFANKIAVTAPVVYTSLPLNSDTDVPATIAARDDDVLPKYYQLYDESAKYTITIKSNGTGQWSIVYNMGPGADGILGTNDDVVLEGKDAKIPTTYVTQYNPKDPSAYSGDFFHDTVGDDYTHTVVWFAVLWTAEAHPDTVVIDYGLPVDISVLANDMFGDYGMLAGVGPYSAELDAHLADNGAYHTPTLLEGFGNSYTGQFGTATIAASQTGNASPVVDGPAPGKVRYTPKNMEMYSHERFAYAVQYTGDQINVGYYYDSVTVIPATTIYYEDSYLDFAVRDASTGEKIGDWETVNDSTSHDGIQDEDRPGRYSLTDANNIYGYDEANLGMSMYSMGSARKVTVNPNTYATATFSFWGTGFDVVSMTSNYTGTMLVEVLDSEGNAVKNIAVDTYYGYTYGLYEVRYTWIKTTWNGSYAWAREVLELAPDKEPSTDPLPENPVDGQVEIRYEYCWKLTPGTDKAIYQVPVIQVEDLTYGHYTVTLYAAYAEVFDHTNPEGYDLYLDAIRIYDPANDGQGNKVIEDAYVTDGEGWPEYLELRDQILSENVWTFGDGITSDIIKGVVFIDGDKADGSDPLVVDKNRISDYENYGPNNEVYLAPGQRVAFMLQLPQNVANVHLGIKSADGGMCTYTIMNVALGSNANGTPIYNDNEKQVGAYYGAKTYTASTTTDMYYDIGSWKSAIIVISNTGQAYGNDTMGVLSLTNIKFTYTANPDQTTPTPTPDPETPEGGENGIQTTNQTEEPQENGHGYVYMTEEAANVIMLALNDPEFHGDSDKAPEPEPEPPVPTFDPEYVLVKLSRDKIYTGDKVLVTVYTGTEVEALTINGVQVTRCTYSRWTNTKIWVFELSADAVGDWDVSVVAWNAAGEFSEAVVRRITVRDAGAVPGIGRHDWLYH